MALKTLLVTLVLPALLLTQSNEQVLFAFTDPQITESSGLADLGDLMATTNDSGDSGRIFLVDTAGNTKRTINYFSDPTDVEGLALSNNRKIIWVADTGDNQNIRGHGTLFRVNIATGKTQQYQVSYPGGSFDVESILIRPKTNRIFLISKTVLISRVFRLPQKLSTTKLNRAVEIGKIGFTPSDAVFENQDWFLVRDLFSLCRYRLVGLVRQGCITLPRQTQGEGVSIGPKHRIRISSEGLYSEVIQVEFPNPDLAIKPNPTPLTPKPTVTSSAPVTQTSASNPEPWVFGSVFAAIGLAAAAMIWLRRRPKA